MIACNGVVHGSPQPVALIHPRTVDGLEEQFELGIVGQPALHSLGLVNDVVVQYQNDSQRLKELDERRRVLVEVFTHTNWPVPACSAPAR